MKVKNKGISRPLNRFNWKTNCCQFLTRLRFFRNMNWPTCQVWEKAQLGLWRKPRQLNVSEQSRCFGIGPKCVGIGFSDRTSSFRQLPSFAPIPIPCLSAISDLLLRNNVVTSEVDSTDACKLVNSCHNLLSVNVFAILLVTYLSNP